MTRDRPVLLEQRHGAPDRVAGDTEVFRKIALGRNAAVEPLSRVDAAFQGLRDLGRDKTRHGPTILIQLRPS